MEEINFFAIDIFITVIVLLSFIVGWARGATKEILSVLSWVGGICLTIFIFPYAKDITRSYIEHGLIADFVTSCLLFILFLTILSVLNYFCSNFVKKSILNKADKVLGGVFGIIRGVVILAIIDVIVNQCILTETPKCVEESKLRPAVSTISNFIILILPESFQDKILSHMPQIKKETFLDFVKKSVIGNINLEAVNDITENTDKNKVFAVNSATVENQIDQNEEELLVDQNKRTSSKTQTAEDLATLKPKKNSDSKPNSTDKSTIKKGRNDMDRILDQYEDTDE